ncbi:uncharacterized protein B0T15DRAFT_507942 [Chaetomium strumarium]|uniref:Uncharacterized protein n=1 Tax=Chaetomium strumarium TaxID=1170767 RepID=A0AAJ0M739_9PEZI|nr:hypothetical protein B0T15DRAFT_507942 [Chaetomium strumarium]
MSHPGDSSKRGIHVCRDTKVTFEDDNGPKDYRQMLPSTAISSSQPPPGSRSKSALRHRSRKPDERGTTKELADFIRNTTPPPSNFMSTPSPSEEEHGKKSRRLPLWPFRKKTEKEEKKRFIKLPDSAVAGMTIGGHRHIAISIPVEYAHLQPVTCKRPVSSAERPDDSARPKEQTGAPPFTPGGDDSLSLPGPSNNSPTEGRRRGEAGKAPECRTVDTALTLRPAATPFQKGPADTTVATTDTSSNREQRHRRESIVRSRSPNTESLPGTSTRRPMYRDTLQKRPSTPESDCTDSSELIYSDAATVRIPTPQVMADLRNSSQSRGSDTGTASFHTPELGYLPLTISSRETMNAWDWNREDSPVFDRSRPQRHSTDELASPHSAFHAQDFRRHTLSALASLESPFGEPGSPQSLYVTPLSVMADSQPSSLGQSAFPHNSTITSEVLAAHNRRSYRPPTRGKWPAQRISGIPNMRDKNLSSAPCFSASESSLARPALTHRASAESIITNPYSTPAPRPAARPTACVHQELVNRYEDPRQPPDRELSALAERLERLEHANERLLSTLVPLFERIADHMVFSGRPSSSRAKRRYSHYSYPSRSDVSTHDRMRRRRRSRKLPERLESVDSFDFDGLDLDRPRVPHLRPQDGSRRNGRARRGGAQGAGEIGYGTEDGDGIHNLSWLRSDSGLDSRETLSSYGGRREFGQFGEFGVPDSLFPESVADDGSWRRPSTRKPRPQDALGENPAGLGSLESVMREVIRGAYT